MRLGLLFHRRMHFLLNESFHITATLGLYLAITAHRVALSQALPLGVACGLPRLDEVAQRDVHRPVALQFAFRAIGTR